MKMKNISPRKGPASFDPLRPRSTENDENDISGFSVEDPCDCHGHGQVLSIERKLFLGKNPIACNEWTFLQ